MKSYEGCNRTEDNKVISYTYQHTGVANSPGCNGRVLDNPSLNSAFWPVVVEGNVSQKVVSIKQLSIGMKLMASHTWKRILLKVIIVVAAWLVRLFMFPQMPFFQHVIGSLVLNSFPFKFLYYECAGIRG